MESAVINPHRYHSSQGHLRQGTPIPYSPFSSGVEVQRIARVSFRGALLVYDGCELPRGRAPQNGLMRLLFLSIQLLDGFESTQDNVEGLLPLDLNFSAYKKSNP